MPTDSPRVGQESPGRVLAGRKKECRLIYFLYHLHSISPPCAGASAVVGMPISGAGAGLSVNTQLEFRRLCPRAGPAKPSAPWSPLRAFANAPVNLVPQTSDCSCAPRLESSVR